MRVLGIDRVVIAVPNVDEAAERFSELLGVSFGEMLHARPDRDGQIHPNGDHTIESRISPGADIDLISPANGGGDVGRFIDQHGPGIYAVAFRVADLDEAREHLADHGVEPVATMNWGTFSELFFDPADFGGVFLLLSEFPHAVETNYRHGVGDE